MKYQATAAACLLMLLTITAPVLAAPPEAPPPAVTITPQRQYLLAESLFREADYATALPEFKRFLFFFPNDSRAAHAALRIGQCQAGLGNAEAAIEALESAAERFPGTPSALAAYFLISDQFHRAGLSAQALINLQNMMLLYPAPGIQDRIRYQMAWIHIDSGRWAQAEDILRQVGSVGREDLPVTPLAAELKRAGQIQYKNPALAGALSIIPGGGQLYCGRHRDALVALLLNGGLIWAAAEAFDKELYGLGAVISVVEFGFYAGNIYGAIGSAHKYNAQQKSAFIEDLKLRFNAGADPFGASSRKSITVGISLFGVF